MILSGLFILGILSLLAWIKAVFRVSSGGKPSRALVSAFTLSLCGTAIAFLSMHAPRSDLWIGDAAAGDGQALIGIFLLGCLTVALGIVLMLLSPAIVALACRKAERRIKEDHADLG